MPEKGTFPRDGGTGEDPIQIREHLERKNEDELFEAVWDELENSEDGAEIDVDKILTYMDMIDDINPLPDLDLSASWKEFEEQYGPVSEGPESAEQQPPDAPVKHKRRRCTTPIRMFLVVLCVSVLLAIVSSCGVIEYIINAVARWTDETFGYEVTSETSIDEVLPDTLVITEYTSLEDAKNDYDITAYYTPQWYPEGFVLYKVKVTESAEIIKLRAEYRKENGQIAISIFHYKDNRPLDFQIVEKDNSIVEEYVHRGVPYYIMKNNYQVNAVWIVDTEEYSITGDCSVQEVKTMIDSIGER